VTVNAGVGLTIDGSGFLVVNTGTGLSTSGGVVAIPGGAITYALLAALSVGAAQIQAAAIATSNLQSGAVTGTKIAAATITTANIANAAITTALIGTAQITTALIANAAITNALLATAVVGTANIQNAAVTNAIIANLAVGDAQINDVSASKITAGTISASISITSPNITTSGSFTTVNISGGQLTCTDGFAALLTLNGGGMSLGGGVALTRTGFNCPDIATTRIAINDGTSVSLQIARGIDASTISGLYPHVFLITNVGIGFEVSGSSYFKATSSGVVISTLSLTTADVNVTGTLRFSGMNSTGSGAAAMGANCPAGTLTAPNTWLQVKNAAGGAGWIPMWT
jgi:hypothetical protein